MSTVAAIASHVLFYPHHSFLEHCFLRLKTCISNELATSACSKLIGSILKFEKKYSLICPIGTAIQRNVKKHSQSWRDQLQILLEKECQRRKRHKNLDLSLLEAFQLNQLNTRSHTCYIMELNFFKLEKEICGVRSRDSFLVTVIISFFKQISRTPTVD